MATFRIEIVSDVVCPWCYIGKRRLEKAMQQLQGELDFEVTYLPFELNPQIPEAGIDQATYFSRKFGSLEKFKQISDHVAQIASTEGLAFNFARQSVAPNTRLVHRLIWLARQHGNQPDVKEAFMKAYFEEGVDLSKSENLVAIAVEAGLPKSSVLEVLQTDAGLHEVVAAEELNYQRGISGVPFYIINGQYGISGAQPTEVFVRALTQISGQVSTANSCDVDNPVC